MNWEALGAIAELLGAVGVIVSLIYLASSIRRDSEATMANTTQLRSAAARETFLAAATSESLTELLARANDTPTPSIQHLMESRGFSQAEAARVNFFWLNMVRVTEANLRMPMSEAERQQTLKGGLGLLKGPGRGWWEHVKSNHSDDFVNLIEAELRKDA
jgi:hypothetical protein